MTGMPSAATNNSLSKICNTNDQSVKPPTFKNVGDCSPNPLRIDALVYMYSLLCVFISQYCNKVDFISMSEGQMGDKKGTVPNWGQGPLVSPNGAATSRHTVYMWNYQPISTNTQRTLHNSSQH